MIDALFLLVLLLGSAIGGIPSVLFARVIRLSDLTPGVATVLGSLVLPLIWVVAMTGGQFAGLAKVPWTFPAVTFCTGLIVCAVYFRSRV
jgi:hypothetical protein